MKIIDFATIANLGITPRQCCEWIQDLFSIKYQTVLPEKISMKGDNNIFVNTMPCKIPTIGRYGVKVVSRYPQRTPALNADIMLYDDKNGDMLALIDGSWITAMRTGAAAATAVMTLKKKDAATFGFLGLGNTARATLLSILSQMNTPIDVVLLAYKGQENIFMKRFENYHNVSFKIVSDSNELVKMSDVVVSCVTAADSLIAADESYHDGVLIVPVHTRGFQNCDLFFDKVVVDDIGHVCGFKYFDRFRSVCELSEVLLGYKKGRENDNEKIIAYNIGLAIGDIYFASKIYDMVCNFHSLTEVNLKHPVGKFWV